MGKSTLKEKIRQILAHIGWKMFIRFQYYGDEERYFRELEKEFTLPTQK